MRDEGQGTGAGATADPGGQQQPRSGEPDHRGAGEATGAWASWLLVAACVVPPLVLAEATRRVLTGAYDEEFYGGYPSGAGAFDGAAPDVSAGRRFGVLWALVGAPDPLWGGVVAALVLLVVVLAGRPVWLVPDRWGRRVAAVGAWLSAALALGSLLGVAQHASAPADESGPGALRFFLRTGLPDDLPGVAAALAVLVPACVVPAVTGVVLWRAPAPGDPADAPHPPRPDDAGNPAGSPEPPADRGTAQAHGSPAAPELPEPPGPREPTGPPTVPEAERELYRRPG